MIRDLELTIKQVLDQGLKVSEKTLFFAESTYWITGESLEDALGDISFEGREALIELIFTPEPDVRLAIEPILGNTGISRADFDDLVAIIAKQYPTIDLVLPDLSKTLSIVTDDDGVLVFLRKLYLDRSLDEQIVNCLKQTFSNDTVRAARVLMRCRGDVFGEEKRLFMCRFISGSSAFEHQFNKLLHLTLTLLSEIDDRQPVEAYEAYFIKKKRALITTLKELKSFADKQDHYSMEYLMMQRFKVPHESEDEVLNQLYLLTTITDVILGLPPDPGVLVESSDLGVFDTKANIDILIKTLS